jgi:DUF4097 and DUF4098 domain-containing protein YvlB
LFTISSTLQIPSADRSGKPGFNKTLLVVLIVVIVVGAIVTVVMTALFLGPSLSVTKKNFTPYSTPVSSDSNNPSSLTVVDTNGNIIITPWSQTNLMINGTVTARGFGTNPDAITYIETNTGGDIVFQAIFPETVFLASASYSVDLNVYVPATAHFKSAQVSTVNGNIQVSGINASTVASTNTNGNIQASGITSKSLTLTDTNGNLDFTCTSCASVTATTTNGGVTATLMSLSLTGSYVMTSTNGNVDLKLPATASAKITANTTNGSVSGAGGIQITNHIPVTLGAGTATVTLTTTNGSVTVTGV